MPKNNQSLKKSLLNKEDKFSELHSNSHSINDSKNQNKDSNKVALRFDYEVLFNLPENVEEEGTVT